MKSLILSRDEICQVKEYFSKHPEKEYHLCADSQTEVLKSSQGVLIAIASKKHHLNAVLGEGTNTTVKRAMDLDYPDQQDELVVKVFHDPLPAEQIILEEAKRLSLVGLQYRTLDRPILGRYIVMKRVSGISLRDYLICSINSSNIASAKLAIAQSLKALQELHGQGQVHGDAHTNNIYFNDQEKSAHLLDMGEATSISPNIDTMNSMFEIYRTLNNILVSSSSRNNNDLLLWMKDIMVGFGETLTNPQERNFFLMKLRQQSINLR